MSTIEIEPTQTNEREPSSEELARLAALIEETLELDEPFVIEPGDLRFEEFGREIVPSEEVEVPADDEIRAPSGHERARPFRPHRARPYRLLPRAMIREWFLLTRSHIRGGISTSRTYSSNEPSTHCALTATPSSRPRGQR